MTTGLTERASWRGADNKPNPGSLLSDPETILLDPGVRISSISGSVISAAAPSLAPKNFNLDGRGPAITFRLVEGEVVRISYSEDSETTGCQPFGIPEAIAHLAINVPPDEFINEAGCEARLISSSITEEGTEKTYSFSQSVVVENPETENFSTWDIDSVSYSEQDNVVTGFSYRHTFSDYDAIPCSLAELTTAAGLLEPGIDESESLDLIPGNPAGIETWITHKSERTVYAWHTVEKGVFLSSPNRSLIVVVKDNRVDEVLFGRY